MKTVYSKDQEAAYQTLSLTIEAAPRDIFHYLGTTEGISQWFPQLAFSTEDNILKLIFDLGDGNYEEMTVEEYDEPNAIGFTWDTGYVRLILEPDGQNTILTLEERLPFEFGNIPQDFTGWQFQVRNIKHISETGSPKEMGDADFKEQEAKAAKELDL
ncbi:hypothetical protein WN59_12435 [Salinicoccus sediminis]|uniref:ATPase n=1 Tax=Salinicoccus sediminis TaxID=1432562 RepID=A0A0M2SGX0_9STAP|nr:hypothetical protein [Salinicoccus sediminis]KKK33543.1 hypothetical protein WN59_12435 [Salinicoccus sediminis]